MHLCWLSRRNLLGARHPAARGIPLKGSIRAVLLDVDDTLYYQNALRCFMALELAALPLQVMSLKRSCKIWRSIRYFRRVREELRDLGRTAGHLAALQYREAARRLGEEPGQMQEVIVEWIDQ